LGLKKNQLRTKEKSSKRKGSLEETISYAMYKDDPELYIVSYRDKDLIKDASLEEFVESEYFAPVPLTRITQLRRVGRGIVWRKGQKQLLVKG
jgi:hypothetical protein